MIGAQAGRYTEQIAHEFDGAAKRNVTDHRERKDDLIEPSLGDRQHEENLAGVIGPGRREDVSECGASLTKLPVGEWAAHAAVDRQSADRERFRQPLNRDGFALIGAQSGRCSTGRMRHESGTVKPRGLIIYPCSMCNVGLNHTLFPIPVAAVKTRTDSAHQCNARTAVFEPHPSFGPIRQHFALTRHLLRASLYCKQLGARLVACHRFTDLTQNSPGL
uniref:hypothetical protein n=1 Tax=Paraburkholderia fungorum TaxID=134537 RepID=UPI0038BB8192